MKKLFFLALLFCTVVAGAQESDIKPAAKGVVYGVPASAEGKAVPASELKDKITGDAFEGKITGKVTEVCKAMGCWIKVEKGDGTSLMVKSKDHSFFMPQDLVGKTVLIEGTAGTKEVSEAQQKHLAEDSGKSKEEIAKIKGARKEVQFTAKGVTVIE